MKKILLCLLALAMSFSMVACGNNNSNSVDESQVSSEEKLPDDEENSDVDSYDWTRVFVSTDLENPFRVRFVDTNPINYATGGLAYLVDDVVQFVDYKSIYAESDFGIDASKATSADKIVKTFEPTFIKFVQYDVTAITTYGEPHIEINTQEDVKINDYDTCKSTGTYYYYPMYSKEDDKETELFFVSYATFLKDGIPVYVTALDASEAQDKHERCEEIAKQMMESLEEFEQ